MTVSVIILACVLFFWLGTRHERARPRHVLFAIKNGGTTERCLRLGDTMTISAPLSRPYKMKLIAIGPTRLDEGEVYAWRVEDMN